MKKIDRFLATLTPHKRMPQLMHEQSCNCPAPRIDVTLPLAGPLRRGEILAIVIANVVQTNSFGEIEALAAHHYDGTIHIRRPEREGKLKTVAHIKANGQVGVVDIVWCKLA